MQRFRLIAFLIYKDQENSVAGHKTDALRKKQKHCMKPTTTTNVTKAYFILLKQPTVQVFSKNLILLCSGMILQLIV